MYFWDLRLTLNYPQADKASCFLNYSFQAGFKTENTCNY